MLKLAGGVLALVVVIAVIVLLVSGGNDTQLSPLDLASPTPALTPTATPTANVLTLGPATVIVRMTDDSIAGSRPSIEPSNGKVTLALLNTSTSPQRFVLARGEPDGAEAITKARVIEVPLKPGQVQTDEVDVRPGTYTLISRASETSAASRTDPLVVR